MDEDESEWEDIKERKENHVKSNTLKLKNFACAVDRYQWSDRGAAMVTNGLRKGLGLIKKGNARM